MLQCNNGKHLWDQIGLAVHVRLTNTTVSADFPQIMVEEWNAIPLQHVTKLVTNMRRRFPVCCGCIWIFNALLPGYLASSNIKFNKRHKVRSNSRTSHLALAERLWRIIYFILFFFMGTTHILHSAAQPSNTLSLQTWPHFRGNVTTCHQWVLL